MSDTTYMQIEPKRIMRINKLDAAHAEHFIDIVARAYKAKKPAKDDLQAIRQFLIEYPEFSKIVFDTVDTTQTQIMKNYVGSEVAQIAIEEHAAYIRAEMGYHEAPIMEKMLIENIITAWLRVQWLEFLITAKMSGEFRIPVMEFWQKSSATAQRSYLAACETLAKIRKMKLPNIQLNIGDKQINVAGDLKPGKTEIINI
jgi:hypothetical protein